MKMDPILKELEVLKSSSVGPVIKSRISEFSSFSNAGDDALWSELCFCLMTANFQVEKSIAIQKALCDSFPALSEGELAAELKRMGHRFPNTRAKFIVQARKHKKGLRALLDSFDDAQARREWLVKNVKGLGLKEASHFLRNIGYKDYAIIDFHIVDKLARAGLIEKPKSKAVSPKRYLEIEQVLEELGSRAGLDHAELDLYLWFSETGKVLK